MKNITLRELIAELSKHEDLMDGEKNIERAICLEELDKILQEVLGRKMEL